MRLIKSFCVNATLTLDTERVLDIEEENVIARVRFALVSRILEYVVQLESQTPGRSGVDTNGEVVLISRHSAFQKLANQIY